MAKKKKKMMKDVPPMQPPAPLAKLNGATLTGFAGRYESGADPSWPPRTLTLDPTDYQASVPGCSNTVSVRRYTGTVNGVPVCVTEVPQFGQFYNGGDNCNLFVVMQSTDGTSSGWTQAGACPVQFAGQKNPAPTEYPFADDNSIGKNAPAAAGEADVYTADDKGNAYTIVPLTANNVTPPFPPCTMPQPAPPADDE